MNETYFVNLSDAVNATLRRPVGVGTITDDDPLPALSINDVTVTEGDAGTVDATFTVSSRRAERPRRHRPLRDRRRQRDGGRGLHAVAATTLTFPPARRRRRSPCRSTATLLDEIDETFPSTSRTPRNATIADAQGLGTITDDDARPRSRSMT